MDAIEVAHKIDERMERENFDEIVSRNTVEASGKFVSTVLYTTSIEVRQGFDKPVRFADTRWAIFVDGAFDSGGLVEQHNEGVEDDG